MGVDAEILILGPFREVVERGKEAVANAKDIQHEGPRVAEPMLKAAQAVVREGERALKRLQPLWDGQIERYGDTFKNSLSQNESIEEKRRTLEDVLYDFEDYTEADTFDAARFTGVQAATRALALSVIDIIKKTRLETQKPRSYSPPPSTKFPPLPPLPPSRTTRSTSVSSGPGISPADGLRPRRSPTPVGVRLERNSSPPPAVPKRSADRPASRGPIDMSSASTASGQVDLVPHPLRVTNGRRNPDQLSANSVRSQRSNRSRMSQVSTTSVESLPPPAYTASGEVIPPVPQAPQDATDPGASSSRAGSPERTTEHERPQSCAPSHDGLQPGTSSPPAGPTGPTYSVFPVQRPNPGARITAWVSDQADPASRLSQHRPLSRFEPHSAPTLQSLTIPEHQAVGVVRPKHSSVIDFSPLTPMLSQLGHFSIESPAASSASVDTNSPERTRMSPLSEATSISDFNSKPELSLPIQTPDEAMEQARSANPTLTPLCLPAAALEQQQQQQQQQQQRYNQPYRHRAQSILSEATTSRTPTSLQNGPSSIPEEWVTTSSDQGSVADLSSHSLSSSQPSSAPLPREPDTSISPQSSLYALSGFCPGGQIFRSASHQDGVRRQAGHVAGVSTFTARCDACSYGHAFAELDLDVNDKSPRATFPRAGGVLFRIRLLYKSHLASQRPSEAFYGCLFCAHAGRVVREGDATVFRSGDDLLRHLARHPQPLPDVAGVTVLYGKEVLATDPRVSDFDLWLTEGTPAPDGLNLLSLNGGGGGNKMPSPDVLARLPVATAARSHVQRYAERKLARPDGKSSASLLQFFTGARIVGVEFVGGMGGKWCVGWHDGDWGYFPSKLVELERPQPGRLDAPPMQQPQQRAGGGGGISVSVVARWKWDPAASSLRDAADKGWLGFDKGERISNVAWPVLVEGVGASGRGAWCWSGTNSKGRFGVFPRSHVDEATLRDEVRPATAVGGGSTGGGAGGGGGGLAGRRKEKGGGKASGMSLFGMRRRNSTASSLSGGVAEIVERMV